MPFEGSRGTQFSEPSIFERGAPGRNGASLAPLDVPPIDVSAALGAYARKEPAGLPEVSEPEAFRHFVRLSQWNYCIDTQLYPLGSCTMKYNPKVNEWAARLPGFAALHPLAPPHLAQGALELMIALQSMLSEIAGMDGSNLQPAAGAQGELTGLMMIRAYHQSRGRSPKKVLIPDSAHGTNPASCSLNGFDTVPVPAQSGLVDPKDLLAAVDRAGGEIAALMITNPNTIGFYERAIPELCRLVHERGGQVYGDGANMNAVLGRARPGDAGVDVIQYNLHKTFTTPHGGGGPGAGPVAFKNHLEPFQPGPVVREEGGRAIVDENRPQSVGRVRSFWGNFGMMVRAYTYIRELGPKGLRDVTDMAVLNAGYLAARLKDHYPLAYDHPPMHEAVFTDREIESKTGVKTLDVAKRLIDYGFHPPTVYFPLVVRGALMIEPTETETKQTIDSFVEAMIAIRREADETPDLVKEAPHNTRVGRLDEARAARQPKLRWR
ncbi:MAG TPA: aminomethyl-transferring glycine dehydrogenase subunit GcvPB [Polyangiaceae bacterium]|jgi:glycine dehydrogenase subunit 2|nr:aminomethyl-transferring glycine dehydrogenase subunit GcvPB [Polyangiaceae bacterium]